MESVLIALLTLLPPLSKTHSLSSTRTSLLSLAPIDSLSTDTSESLLSVIRRVAGLKVMNQSGRTLFARFLLVLPFVQYGALWKLPLSLDSFKALLDLFFSFLPSASFRVWSVPLLPLDFFHVLAFCWSTFSLILSKVECYLISDVKWGWN